METTRAKVKMKVAELFSRSLCLSGTSQYDTFLAKNKTLILDFLFGSLSSNILRQHSAGSTAEGTATYTSDVDNMMVVPDVFVKPAIDDNNERSGHVFLLETKNSRPGYAQLRLLQIQDTDYQLFDGYGANINEMLEATDHGTFLSSEKFANFFVSTPGKAGLSGDYFRHGPCVTAEHTDVHGFVSSEPGFKVERDVAHALEITSWPEEGKEWLTRERHHDWPAPAYIDKIRKQPCFAVPIGDTSSDSFALEWRISFLLSERELVWSFNDTQLHCYVTLKKMIKAYLDPLAPDQLSSYNLKTIIFWLSEENELSIWQNEKFIACLELCLNRLLTCVEEGCLSHYFNRRSNLLGHKFNNTTHREQVTQKIKEINSDLVSFVVENLPLEWNLPDIWKKCQMNEKRLIEISLSEQQGLNDKYTTGLKQDQVLKLYRTMFNILLQIVTLDNRPESLLRQLIALQNDPPDGVDTIVTEMSKLFLDLRFGMAYMRQMTLQENDDFQRYIDGISLSSGHSLRMMSNAVWMDKISGTLYLANAYQHLVEPQKSIDLLTSLLQQHKHLVYTGWCSTYVGIRLDHDGIAKPEPRITLQGSEERTYAAYDVIFSYKDTHCVPYPVQFECALSEFDVNRDDFIVIHPCVYAYFLLFYGYFSLRNHPAYEMILRQLETVEKALSQLETAVVQTQGGLERHHALNILGYCFTTVGRFHEGFQCYKESLQETGKLIGVTNAAAYHVAILILQFIDNAGSETEAKL